MFPENFSLSWLAIPTLLPILALIVWPLATIVGYIGARFRDLPNALALVLQAAWFVSPVYFKESMFRQGGLNAFVDYNPIYHVMQILRAPVLYGEWPTATNYIWCLGVSLLLTCVAVAVGMRAEKRAIFTYDPAIDYPVKCSSALRCISVQRTLSQNSSKRLIEYAAQRRSKH